jgi:tetratricopeptide (TPR) repeat protein
MGLGVIYMYNTPSFSMRTILACLMLMLVSACKPANQLSKYYSPEDQQLSALMATLKKDPTNKQALEALPEAYETAMQQKLNLLNNTSNVQGYSGAFWEANLKEWEVAQQLNAELRSIPGASSRITEWYDFSDQILRTKNKAAEAYYSLGLEYMSYQNRPYAQKALEEFRKADRMIPGYKDVRQQMSIAEEMATITVVVNQVDYYRHGWNYWGFNNDYLQWRIINDLNARSYQNVRFFSDAEAAGRRLHPDRIVDLDFTNIFINNPYTERYSYTRTKQIPNPNPRPKPQPRDIKIAGENRNDYITVRATVSVTKRLVTGDGMLQCRIYDMPSGRNILFDNFPGRYQWVFETATYTGDSRALEPQDWTLINNRFTRYPTRNDVAQKIVEDSYFLLMNRINSGVSFY